MTPSTPQDPKSDPAVSSVADGERTAPGSTAPNLHPDPITGEPDAHPVGVGIGALSAGATVGAAVGLFAGPVGALVGAAIGAVAGGLAGKEIAESAEVSPTSEAGEPLDEFDHPATDTASSTNSPLPAAIAERIDPPSDAFFTGGGGDDMALDSFDRPPAAAVAQADRPLPTASSGLITPEPEGFFADSTTGESSILTEHPLPAAQAVSPGDNFAAVETGGADSETYLDTEQTIRTNAYYKYLHREANGTAGSDFGDWIEAEREILGR